MKMKLDYAKDFITKGRAGHYRTISCHDDLLVVEDLETYQSSGYLGTQLSFGQLVTDSEGYVVFRSVTPVINKDTRWKL